MEKAVTRMIRLPVLLVGFKAYIQATGGEALKLAKMAARVTRRTGISIVLIPQFTDIAKISQEVGLPVFAQHIDPIRPGSFTGYVLPEAVREAGAVGTLIGHSERKLPLDQIELAVCRAREVGLLSCVCCDSPELSGAVSAFHPSMILVEQPDLIGKGRAISKVNPETLTRTLQAVRAVGPDICVVCGAGITTAEDVIAALRLGMDGVGAASAIVKASDPYSVMMEMAEALRSNWGRKRPILKAGIRGKTDRQGDDRCQDVSGSSIG